jgi:hypothetical protein
MTTGHNFKDEVIRNRRRPKKSSTNKTVTWPIFDGNSRKDLPIPTYIDMYNYYMGGIDIANVFRATVTTHFNRCQKEYFPGIFFSFDISAVNLFKLYESLNGPFLYTSGKPTSIVYRDFLESLVDLIFLCDLKEYANIVSGISFQSYPKYSYPKISKSTLISFPNTTIEEHICIKASIRLICTSCKKV